MNTPGALAPVLAGAVPAALRVADVKAGVASLVVGIVGVLVPVTLAYLRGFNKSKRHLVIIARLCRARLA